MKTSILPYLGQFLFGVSFILLIKSQGQRRTSLILVFAGIICSALVKLLGITGFLMVFCNNFSMAAFFVGIGLIRCKVKLPGDISYGLYLYHALVINILVITFAEETSMAITTIYFISSFCLAIASWFLIEEPCLSMRKHSV